MLECLQCRSFDCRLPPACPHQAVFDIFVRTDATSGRHECRATLLCGTCAADLRFSITVSDLRDVMRAAGVAAASAARSGTATDDGLRAGGVGEMGARMEQNTYGPSTQLNILETRFESLPVSCPVLHMDDVEVQQVRAPTPLGGVGHGMAACCDAAPASRSRPFEGCCSFLKRWFCLGRC